MSGDLKCPYCLWPIKGDEAVEECAHCSARYHAECWAENGGCGTFGCPAWAAGQTGTALPPPPATPRGNGTAASGPNAAPVVVSADPLPPVAAAARRFCDMCGQPVTADDRFCGGCGNIL